MPKASLIQDSFAAGEISPLAQARVATVERVREGLKTCLNWVPVMQGGLTRRPGTAFVAEGKFPDRKIRLHAFEYSTTQAYMIEFGHQYIRFHKDNAVITLTGTSITGISQANPGVVTAVGHGLANGDRVILSGVVGMVQVNNREFIVAGVTANTFQLTDKSGANVNTTGYTAYSSGGTVAKIYEVSTTYTESQLFQLKFAQSTDTLYIAHPSVRPRSLTRSAHTSWTLSYLTLSGPWDDYGDSSITLTPSATTGLLPNSVTLTASAALFTAFDTNRTYLIKHGSTWGIFYANAFVSDTQLTGQINADFPMGATTASSTWKASIWNSTLGYPAAVGFFEDRLFFGGSASFPQRFDGSDTAGYSATSVTFHPFNGSGTVSASNAVSFVLNARDVNNLRWFESDEKGLVAGTVGNEWMIRPSSAAEALSPTNISAKPATSWGSADIDPLRVDKSILFVQRAGRKLREFTYFYEVDGFRAPDLSVLAEHVTQSGIVQMAYQKEPHSVIWCVRTDGYLAALTYEREADNLRVGWHRHQLGGYGNAANGNAVVESVAVMPSADGSYSEVWLSVKRYVNGATTRHIEYLSKFFEESDDQEDAFFVDSGLTLDNPKTITGITQANPAVVTSASHGFSNGDTLILSEIEGMTELNGRIVTVANAAANTFELSGINSTSYSAYVSGGEARKRVSTVSGLWHLNGQTVEILGDGAEQPTKTVSNGSVALASPAAVVHIGLGYNSDGQKLRDAMGSADGTAYGKNKRIHKVGIDLYRTLGLKIGRSFSDLKPMRFRDGSDDIGEAPPLFTGIKTQTVEFKYDTENQLCFRQSGPLPATILAIMTSVDTQDAG